MDMVELSRYVRDLCRQHDFDREAWKQLVETTGDHAKRLDHLDHELLQVNDQVSGVCEGANVIYRENAKKNKEEYLAAMQACK